MIIEGSATFVSDINRLKSGDAKSVKAFLRAICDYIRGISAIDQLVAIPLSNCFVFQECGETLEGHLAPEDKIFRISFEGFNLFVLIQGGNPKKCGFLALEVAAK